MKIRKKELAKLINRLQESYASDYTGVSRDLHKAVYFLHFLEKDEIPRNEVQDLCFALHKLGECFYHAHSEQRIYRQRNITNMLGEIAAILKEE